MGNWLLAPLGLVVAVTLCGCASGSGPSHRVKQTVEQPVEQVAKRPARPARPAKPASLAELRWIGKLDSQYQHDGNFAASCQIAIHTGLGKPPTRRLWRYVAKAALACKAFNQGTSESGPEAQKSLDRSVALMRRANQDLDQLRPSLEALPRIAGSSAESRIALRYTRVAAVIGGNSRVLVRCWSHSDWNQVTMRVAAYWGTNRRLEQLELLGFVMEPHFISLSPVACRSLDKYTYKHVRPKDTAGLDEVALGLNALAHESEHIRHPYKSEAVVECYALQSIDSVARLLGGGRGYGERVARDFVRHLYAEQLPAYKTAACRNGGPLDEHPNWPRWP